MEGNWDLADGRDVVIIGSGPAGCTAAIYLGRAGFHPLVIHGNVPGGQLTTTTFIENFPGFSGTGSDLMQKMEDQATSNGATFEYEVVEDVDLKSHPKRIRCNSKLYTAKAVIIATGATAKYLGLESEQRLLHRGVSACATCDGPLYKGEDVVVIGGGDTAAEEALFLSAICNSVTLVHRRNELRASTAMKQRVTESTKIKMKWDSEVKEVLGDQSVTGIVLKSTKNPGEQETIHCKAIFVAIGHSPSTDPFKAFIAVDDTGYFSVNAPLTGIDGVFVAGDCADKVYRQAIHAAGMGCAAAEQARKYLETLTPASLVCERPKMEQI